MSANTLLKEPADQDLAARILQTEVSGEAVATVLTTDDRVIARVTDGIYRQPASALRELISNAYDADATRVIIRTDAPRFDEISVEDNGLGMSVDALARTLHHIGGSAKRHEDGSVLGITSSHDTNLSPGGRPLIGKIGIGMFSVSQLTHSFQIITKVKNDNYRTIATVALRQYSDESEAFETFESGKVNVWREPAQDLEAQGTTIILNKIRPHAQNLLRSKELWAAVAEFQPTSEEEIPMINPPKYHVGRVDESGELLAEESKIPWLSEDSPEDAFRKLVDAVWDEYNIGNVSPQLDKLFDNYLYMIWQIGLSIPTNYVDGHLFDMDLSWAQTFLLSNRFSKGSTKQVETKADVPIRDIFDLKETSTNDTFDVFVDDLKLSRPIKYRGLPHSTNSLKTPFVYIGKCREEFTGIAHELSGGPLEFEAYLFWNSKIAPSEHRGALIRIHGASGAGFDPSFMRYQVAEQNRMKQITCEIFVQEGFDAALNIDRESFNYAHPHAVFLTKWLHSAIRQLASTNKRIAKEITNRNRTEWANESLDQIQKIVIDTHRRESSEDGSEPLSISIVDNNQSQSLFQDPVDLVFSKEVIIPETEKRKTPKYVAESAILTEKIKAIAQVLASFGLMEGMDKRKQERLLKAIYEIIETTAE